MVRHTLRGYSDVGDVMTMSILRCCHQHRIDVIVERLHLIETINYTKYVVCYILSAKEMAGLDYFFELCPRYIPSGVKIERNSRQWESSKWRHFESYQYRSSRVYERDFPRFYLISSFFSGWLTLYQIKRKKKRDSTRLRPKINCGGGNVVCVQRIVELPQVCLLFVMLQLWIKN